jgi:hypothetical protein
VARQPQGLGAGLIRAPPEPVDVTIGIESEAVAPRTVLDPLESMNSDSIVAVPVAD